MDSLQDGAARVESLAGLSRFRRELYECLSLRADALLELTDAVLCAGGHPTYLRGLLAARSPSTTRPLIGIRDSIAV
jgi:hypothetical protein